jgi:phosphate starvation-inducible PhoH-like protein
MYAIALTAQHAYSLILMSQTCLISGPSATQIVPVNIYAGFLQGDTVSRNRAAKAQRRMTNSIENTINFDQISHNRLRPIDLVPRSRNQETLVLALQDRDVDIVAAVGPAGTGKTYLAMLAAVKALRERRCERIILTRPAVEVEGEQHGFLPGDLVRKMEPWTRPLLDVLREQYKPREIADMIDDQIVEISPLAFMRGRTFKSSWIIADEMQNATPAQMKMLLTRIGAGSKIVVTGDVEQTDRSQRHNGLADLCARLAASPAAGLRVCELNQKDIQRHPVINRVLELYA